MGEGEGVEEGAYPAILFSIKTWHFNPSPAEPRYALSLQTV